MWVGLSLPGRPVGGTYGTWPLESLPSLANLENPFAHITEPGPALDAIVSRFQSPTDCYFDTDDSEGTFYRDSQDCVLWKFDSEVFYETETGRQNLGPLPQFLHRIWIENEYWWHAQTLTFQMDILNRKSITTIPESMDAGIGVYLKHYAKMYSDTYRFWEDSLKGEPTWMPLMYDARTINPQELWKNTSHFNSDLCSALAAVSMHGQIVNRNYMGRCSPKPFASDWVDNRARQFCAIRRDAVLAWMMIARKCLNVDRDIVLLIGRLVYATWFFGQPLNLEGIEVDIHPVIYQML